MKRFIIPLATVAVVVSMLLAGCMPGAAPTPPVTPPPVTPPPVTPPPVTPPEEEWPWVVVDEWKIPDLGIHVGDWAFIGRDITWCYEWASDQINANGGIAGKPLVFEFHETEASAERGAVEMSKVAEWALLTYGPWHSIVHGGAGPVAVEKGIYMLTDCSGVEVSKKYRPWSLSMLPENDTVWPMGTQAWIKEANITKICPICSPVSEQYLEVTQSAMSGAEAVGVEVTEWVNLPEDIVDFGAPAVKALDSGADGFFFLGTPAHTSKVFVEMKKRGLEDNTKVCLGWGQDTPEWWEAATGYMEDAYSIGQYNTQSKDPRWVAFSEWKKTTHDVDAYDWNIPMLDQVYLIKAAIEDCKITGDPAKLTEERIAIRDYLNNLKDFPGVGGTFDIVDGVLVGNVFLFQSHNDKFTILGSVDQEGNLHPVPD